MDLSRCDDNEFNLIDYWRRCLYAASAARRVAMAYGQCDADEAFLAAMMQDLGMLAIHATTPKQYAALVAQTEGRSPAARHPGAGNVRFQPLRSRIGAGAENGACPNP